MGVHTCTCTHTCILQHVKIRVRFVGGDSSYSVGPGIKTQIVRFGGKYLYLLSHLTNPRHIFSQTLIYSVILQVCSSHCDQILHFTDVHTTVGFCLCGFIYFFSFAVVNSALANAFHAYREYFGKLIFFWGGFLILNNCFHRPASLQF